MAVKRTGTIYSAAPGFFGKISRACCFAISRACCLAIKKTFELIGRPFYWALLGLALAVGYLLSTISRLRPPKIRLPKIRLPKLKLPKISLPRLKISPKRMFFVLLVFLLLFTIYYLLFTIFSGLPSPNRLVTREQIVTTKIFDRNGNLLYKIYRNQNRTLVELKDVPLSLIQATIAIEDAEFYQHHGFSFKGILRAFWVNLKKGKIEGGSTITQQLVKNALLSPERTWQRKIKEIILALMVEQKFAKDQILQMYLNEVGYGGAAYGVEEASQLYFGKSVTKLTLVEAALLAGLPASPTTYSPFGTQPEKAKERQLLVLRRMRQEGFITEEEEKQAASVDLVFAPQRTDIKAPHFVMYIKDLLVKKYGERMVEEGGLEVKTSLDLEIQNQVQEIVAQEIKNLKNLRISNGAALVTNPKTGEILAMVGSKDYFDIENDGNVNVTLRPRQPGSAIKPVNYSIALENGFTPATIIPDTPITYQIPGQPPYSPKNYDSRFHGDIPLRIALGSSYNVPAVKVLSAFGVERMVKRGQEMGITTWEDPSRFGLSLTLGGGEVKMVDMAVAYGTLANSGTRVDLQPILEVKDYKQSLKFSLRSNYKGKVLEKNDCQDTRGARQILGGFTLRAPTISFSSRRSFARESEAESKLSAGDLSVSCNGTRILSPQVSYILTDILSDNSARTPAFGPSSWLNIANHPHIAVKTGTTQNLRDNWTIGYTPDFLVAVWVGNNDNTPMSYVASGVTGASPIWNKIMSHVLADVPDKEFPKPEDLIQVEICSLTGTLPCEGCPTRIELFLPGTEPKTHCVLSPTPTPPL